MILTKDQQQVKDLLKETITMLCKNGLHFKTEFSIEALIGITIDSSEVFLMNICETYRSENETNRTASVNDSSDDSQLPKSEMNRTPRRDLNFAILPAKPCSQRTAYFQQNESNPSFTGTENRRRKRNFAQTDDVRHTLHCEDIIPECEEPCMSKDVQPKHLDQIGLEGTYLIDDQANDESSRSAMQVKKFCGSVSTAGGRSPTAVEHGSDVDDGTYEEPRSDYQDYCNHDDPNDYDGRDDDVEVIQVKTEVMDEDLQRLHSSYLSGTSSRDLSRVSQYFPSHQMYDRNQHLIQQTATAPHRFNIQVHGQHGQRHRDLKSIAGFAMSAFDNRDNVVDNFAVLSQSLVPSSLVTVHDADAKLEPPTSFTCHLCGAVLEPSWTLYLSHLKIHRVGRNEFYKYPCPCCEKRFSSHTNLRGHMAKHTGIKEFVCQVCGKEYAFKQMLKDHMLSAHPHVLYV